MFERRLKLLLFFLSLVTLVLVLRAFSIQVVHHAYWSEESTRVSTDDDIVETSRGRILDVKGRELAVDEPCIDVCIDYRVIPFELDLKSRWSRDWLRALSRERLVRNNESFLAQPRSRRIAMITDELQPLQRDVGTMWRELAKLCGLTDEQMDEKRREIVRLVETRRRALWFNKFEQAKKNRSAEETDAWYSWLLGKTELNIDNFSDVQVAEQIQPHVIIPNVSYAVRNQIATQIERFPGLTLRSGVVRTYPYKSVACQTIGTLRKVDAKEIVDRETARAQSIEERLRNYRATDDIGRSGLEASMEEHLRGARGLDVKDADGNLIRQIKPDAGQDLQTTLDIDLQAAVENAFKTVSFHPYNKAPMEQLEMRGAAVVIDIPTGEVRALVSYPTYDLNRFDELYDQLARDVINRPMANRAVTSALEPGSTVKPIIGLGAITDGLLDPHGTIECTGYVVLDGKQYSYGRCWTMKAFHIGHHQVPSDAPHPTGFLTFADALERSCNVFHEELGDKLGIGGISMWFDKFGLGRRTGIELADVPGRLPDQAQLDGPASAQRSIAWFAAIGQGEVAATPIQMANVAATIARRGIWVRPTLVHRTSFGPDDQFDLHLNQAAVSEAHKGMIAVVNGDAGTGTVPHMDQLLVAGKTGSAQSAPLTVEKLDAAGKPIKDEKGRTIRERIALGTTGHPNPEAPWYRASGDAEDSVSSHAWMISFAPANHPKIAIAAMVEYGGGGGTAAGSVIKQTLEACVRQGYLPAGNR